MDHSLADIVFDDLVAGSSNFLSLDASYAVQAVLISAFGIAVGFVAYKLIKRALNKA